MIACPRISNRGVAAAARCAGGYTLIELVVTMGLMTVVAMAVASLVNNQMKAQASLDSRVEFTGIVQELEQLALTPNCSSFFSSTRSLASDAAFNTPPIQQIPEQPLPSASSSSSPPSQASGSAAVPVFARVGGYLKFQLTGIQLADIVQTGGDPKVYLANLVLTGTPGLLPVQTLTPGPGGNANSAVPRGPAAVGGNLLLAKIPMVLIGSNGVFSGCGSQALAAINIPGGGNGLTQTSPFPQVSTWGPVGTPWLKQSTLPNTGGYPNCPTSALDVANTGMNCVTPSSYFPGRYLLNTFAPVPPAQTTQPSRGNP